MEDKQRLAEITEMLSNAYITLGNYKEKIFSNCSIQNQMDFSFIETMLNMSMEKLEKITYSQG